MKKITLLLILLSTFLVNAQQKDFKSNYVTVTGKVLVERTVDFYSAKITFSTDQLFYNNTDITTLSGLKEAYFKKLKETNINPSKFKEVPLEYLGYGYQREGTVYKFETASKEEVQKLSEVKMTGITISYQVKSVLKPEQLIQLKEKAIADAKENALRICKITNKKLGDIIGITDSLLAEEYWGSLQDDYKEYSYVTISYELK